MKIRNSSKIIILLLFWNCQDKKHFQIDLKSEISKTEIFAESLVSTGLYERDIAISPDGKEIIFTRGDIKQNKRCLFSVKKNGHYWQEPELLNFSGHNQDIEPFLANDGQRLYFASNRPISPSSSASDYNIWYVDKLEDKWSKPIALDTMINTKGDEFYPSLSTNGNLYFTATKKSGIGREDIFVAKSIGLDQFENPTPLDTTVNTKFFEFNAFISPNEDLLIFSSYGRSDDIGGGDLYYSIKDQEGNWQKSQNMGEKINSSKLDYCPFVDFENNVLYFTSERLAIPEVEIESNHQLLDFSYAIQNGAGDIYRISFEELNLLEKN